MCQRTKVERRAASASLQPHLILGRLWSHISMDLIGTLPLSHSKDAILVVMDHFSKQVHAIPTLTSLTAQGTAKLLRDNIFHLHGVPDKIIQ